MPAATRDDVRAGDSRVGDRAGDVSGRRALDDRQWVHVPVKGLLPGDQCAMTGKQRVEATSVTVP